MKIFMLVASLFTFASPVLAYELVTYNISNVKRVKVGGNLGLFYIQIRGTIPELGTGEHVVQIRAHNSTADSLKQSVKACGDAAHALINGNNPNLKLQVYAYNWGSSDALQEISGNGYIYTDYFSGSGAGVTCEALTN